MTLLSGLDRISDRLSERVDLESAALSSLPFGSFAACVAKTLWIVDA